MGMDTAGIFGVTEGVGGNCCEAWSMSAGLEGEEVADDGGEN